MNEKCFAMRKSGMCGALDVKACVSYHRCPFYKPVWMFKRNQERINVRLSALPKEKQQIIADKYHNGRMPWKGDHE